MSEYIKKEDAVKELLRLAQNLLFCEQIYGAIRAVEVVCGIPMCDVVERNADVASPADFAEAMRQIHSGCGDAENKHMTMDAVMVGILRGLGYSEAMDIFEAEDKWYS